MSEDSQSPSRVSKLFKTKTRERKSAANSLKSEASDNSHGLRGSVEGAIDKLRGGSIGSDDEEQSGGIKKLVPKGLVSKRRRRKQEEELRATEEAEAEAARGRSIADRGRLANDSSKSLTQHHQSNGSRSSLITVDSDTELPFETKPTLSTHPSHAGYLTTSSPLVKSSIIPDTSQIHSLDGTTSRSKSTDSVNIVAASDSASSSASDKLRAPNDKSQKRSPSPVGRLREKLNARRGVSPNLSPNRSPEREAPNAEVPAVQEKDNTGDNTGQSRRGSVVSRLFEKQGQPLGSINSSPELPRNPRVPQPIDTNARPQTPPDTTAPLIVNTPPTPTEDQAGRFSSSRDRGSSDPVPSSNSNVVTSPSGNMISHRRVRSNSAALGPSKLSNITSAPLTPTPENGTATPNQSSFFSSVFSAAQNAANTLSNSIANTSVAPNGNKHKGGSTQELKDIVESPEVETLAEKPTSNTADGEKELAVKTLGMGDLSLSHLGITETASASNTPTASKFPDDARKRPEDNKPKNDLPNEDSFGGRSAATPAAEGFEYATAPAVEDTSFNSQRSNYEPSAGEQTPPNGSVFEGKAGIHRSGSIRSSKFGNRRKRGSSAATGTTIGAAIMASHTSLTSPGGSTTPKVTGFAVASKKRNRDFHNLFRSVPEDDYLIEDYSCALQREILAHGRLYVSEGHLCFSSNIFGWVTTLVMSFDEIVSVEKRSTALLFKNGLMISTLHAKNVFASFTSRDSTYDLIVGIWKLGHPSLRSSLNGVSIEETGGGDKTEKFDGDTPIPAGSQSGSDSESDDEDGDEIYDEDEGDEDGMSFTQADGSVAGSDVAEKVVSRKPSAAVVTNGAPLEKSKDDTPAAPAGDFPGPATHAPTTCSDQPTHYAKILADEVISAPLGKIYSMMFGPASTTWMKNFLTVDQKCFELTMEGTNALPLTLENKVRNYTYIKPLTGAIGPKQTKCINVETLDALDLEKAVSITISTQNPDVPSGNVFSVKTKYCLTWAENNATRIQINCAIEWTGKSWLKGPIEKGANDGQTQYAKDVVAALKAAVSSRRPTVVTGGKGKKKGRKGRESRNINKTTDGASDPKPTVDNWGLFEPLHGIFGPIVDILGPLLTGNILYGLLVGLLVASWFRYGFTGRGGSQNSMGFLSTPERVAAYEEMWRREESELWEWLEDRVGSGRLRDIGKMPIEAKSTEERLRSERMEEREIDAAIRVTEERLRVLKDAVGRKKGAAANEGKKEVPPPVELAGEEVVG